jgi:hypothetical protein
MDLGLHIAVHARKKSFLRHTLRLTTTPGIVKVRLAWLRAGPRHPFRGYFVPYFPHLPFVPNLPERRVWTARARDYGRDRSARHKRAWRSRITEVLGTGVCPGRME